MLRNDLWIDMKEIGTLTEAARLINDIFDTTQREADQHIKYAKEQGINPSTVRVAKPAMPITAMPSSAASAKKERIAAVQAKPEPKRKLQAKPKAETRNAAVIPAIDKIGRAHV